jgi:hypothetical protein
MKAFHLESRNGSLGESLSHPPSAVGLDEQRHPMVLELYYRKAGRKREGRRERGPPRRLEGGRLDRKSKRERGERRGEERRGEVKEKGKRREECKK